MYKKYMIFLLGVFVIVNLNASVASTFRPIVLDPPCNHYKWGTLPKDHIFKFAAYTSSFDGVDDNDVDGDPDKWGIPEWVAFKIKKVETEHHLANRPSWMTDAHLFTQGIAPGDESYKVLGANAMRG